MKDQIFHGIICDGEAALLIINSSQTAKTARDLLNLNDGATMILGRLMAAGVMLAQRNKEKSEKLTLMINGGGPIGKILITAENDGHVKGCVDHPDAILPTKALSLPALVGNSGQLTVIRDNPVGEPYVGVTNLVSGDITRDFAAYLVSSEQQPAAVALDCKVNGDEVVCGGIMVMPLPGCTNQSLDNIDKKISEINDLCEKFEKYESCEEMAYDTFWDIGIKPLETVGTGYYCSCNRQRFENGLISLGKNQLLSLAYEEEDTEIKCNFCNKKYTFSRDEIKALAKEL